jgi:hypothetical protein
LVGDCGIADLADLGNSLEEAERPIESFLIVAAYTSYNPLFKYPKNVVLKRILQIGALNSK